MPRRYRLVLNGLAAVIVVTIVTQANLHSEEPPREDREALIERGGYLVHDVAMCVQCHTPRTRTGALDRTRLLRGAPIPVRAPAEGDWAFTAPRLAGLRGWEDAVIVSVLRTGRRPDGRVPRPPMPPFRLTDEDARAVVTYLRSLD